MVCRGIAECSIFNTAQVILAGLEVQEASNNPTPNSGGNGIWPTALTGCWACVGGSVRWQRKVAASGGVYNNIEVANQTNDAQYFTFGAAPVSGAFSVSTP